MQTKTTQLQYVIYNGSKYYVFAVDYQEIPLVILYIMSSLLPLQMTISKVIIHNSTILVIAKKFW